jgi:hypothetical protein
VRRLLRRPFASHELAAIANVACPRCGAAKKALCRMRDGGVHRERVDWWDQHQRELRKLAEWNAAARASRRPV